MKFQEPYNDEVIEAYLNGELDEQQQAAFQKALEEQPQLAKRVTQHQNLLEELQIYGNNELLKGIQQTEKKLEEEGFFVPDDQIDQYLVHYPQKIADLLSNYPQLAARVEERQALIEAIEQQGEQDLQASIQGVEAALAAEGFFEQAVAKEAPTGRRHLRWLYRITAAAAVLLLVILASQYLLNPPNKYQQYFTAMEEDISDQVDLELSEEGFAGEPDPGLKQLAAALDAYEEENFKQAIHQFENYLATTSDQQYQPKAKLYLAISQLGNQQPKSALPILKELDLADQQEAIDWYKALAYLQTQQPQAAKELLQQLTTNTKYQDKAKKILTQIK